MTEAEKFAALAGQPFFRGLANPFLTALSAAAKDFAAAPGEYLARENETADRFILLLTGRAALDIPTPKRGPVTVQTVGAGEVVGWSWLVPPHRWNFDVRVTEQLTGLAWDGDRLRQECDREHELGLFILKRLVGVIAGRLAATRLQLLDIYH